MSAYEETVERANRILDSTSLFGDLGLAPLVAESRTVARDVIALVDELEAERSARRALQKRCDTQQEILGKAVYAACVKGAK